MVLDGDHERRVHPADLDQIVDLAGLGRQDLADRCHERPEQDKSKQPHEHGQDSKQQQSSSDPRADAVAG